MGKEVANCDYPIYRDDRYGVTIYECRITGFTSKSKAAVARQCTSEMKVGCVKEFAAGEINKPLSGTAAEGTESITGAVGKRRD